MLRILLILLHVRRHVVVLLLLLLRRMLVIYDASRLVNIRSVLRLLLMASRSRRGENVRRFDR